MAICPFLNQSVWSGNKCKASGEGDGAPVQKRYVNYCGVNLMSDDYHKCPLYVDATGKKVDGGCYLTSACMSVKGEGFMDECMELVTLRKFRDTYVKENYPQDIEKYYELAPQIVEKICRLQNSNYIFDKIYEELVMPCCDLIERDKLCEAYDKYKGYTKELQKQYLD